MSRLKVVVFAVIAASCIIFGLLWIRKEPSEPVSEKSLEAPSQADLSIKGLDYVQTEDGIREWRLTAGSAHYSKQAHQTRLENVTFTYFTKDQKQVVMTGREGVFNTKSLDVEICGNVEIRSDEGYEFRAPSVKYVARAKEIRTPDEVVFKGSQFQVTGTGMRVFINKGKLVIMSKVKATITGDVRTREKRS
jgi:LPS export ABC transporter protein LptC